MNCVSCKEAIGDAALCVSCGAVQPVPDGGNLFRVLGVPQTYFLELAQIESQFKALNKKLHPDRFARKSAGERLRALEWTTAINEAYRTLKDPLKRAIYLLKANGIELEREGGGGALPPMPAEFLEEIMELREGLEEAKAAKDLARVRGLADDVKQRTARVAATLDTAFKKWDDARDQAALQQAASALAVLKYYRRFLEEVEVIEQEALAH